MMGRFFGPTDKERGNMEVLRVDQYGRMIDEDGDPIPNGPHWVTPEKQRRRYPQSNVQTYTRGSGKLFWADEREGKR
jgi:hypothetical protein